MTYRERITEAVEKAGFEPTDVSWRVIAPQHIRDAIVAECPDMTWRVGSHPGISPNMLYVATDEQVREWANQDWELVMNGVSRSG